MFKYIIFVNHGTTLFALTSTSILGSAKKALLSLRTPMCSETKASTRSASSGMRDMMAAMERSSRQFSCRGFSSIKFGSFGTGSDKFVQGDHSGCAKPPVDTKTKVPF